MEELHDTLRQLIGLCDRLRDAIDADDGAFEDLDRQRAALAATLPAEFPRDAQPLLVQLHEAGERLAVSVQAKRDEALRELTKTNTVSRRHGAYHGRARGGGYQTSA